MLQTAEELQRGNLIGLSRTEVEGYAKDAGFSFIHTEIIESHLRDPKRPTADFYFRFEK